MRASAAKMLAMQARHPDRRLYAAGEWESYPHPEAASAWVIADAFLLYWLHACGAIPEYENWLERDR